MQNIDVQTYSFKKADMPKIMDGKTCVMIDDEIIRIDPNLMFQRMLVCA